MASRQTKDEWPLYGAYRILVYGVTGSGKTTLAAKTANATGIPWHSVDDLTYEPGWVQVPLELQRERFEAICGGDRWILDTAYGTWRDIPLKSVELIVALDYPRCVSFSRLLVRTLRRVTDKRPICNGNHENWRNMLSKDSILLWHIKSFKRKRERIREFCDTVEGPTVLRFTSPRQTEEWLKAVTRICAAGQP